MRIISSFKDYYDCIQRYGQQNDLQFIREEKEIILKHHYTPHGTMYIGFCGKIYPLIAFGSYFDKLKERHICYSIEDLDKYYAQYMSEESRKVYEGKSRYYNHWSRQHYIKFFKGEEVNNHLRVRDNYDTKTFFEEYKCPIFTVQTHNVYCESLLTLNPRLNQYRFERIMPPYQAFQELEMWHSNQVKPFKPIPTVSDKDLAAAKGYDKFSFRKAKSK